MNRKKSFIFIIFSVLLGLILGYKYYIDENKNTLNSRNEISKINSKVIFQKKQIEKLTLDNEKMLKKLALSKGYVFNVKEVKKNIEEFNFMLDRKGIKNKILYIQNDKVFSNVANILVRFDSVEKSKLFAKLYIRWISNFLYIKSYKLKKNMLYIDIYKPIKK